jgi:nicotinamide-nucleotide amidase
VAGEEGREARRGTLSDPSPPDVAEHVDLVELTALAGRVQEAALAAGWSVATAESCTGGLIGHLLTEVPGSSRYFLGGVVSYADALKADILGVPRSSLEQHGAVSAQVAGAMARGARRLTGADVAVAVTGVAGPGGGSAAKPVGLTYVAIADARGVDVRRFTWDGERSWNKRRTARAALELLRDALSSTGPDAVSR